MTSNSTFTYPIPIPIPIPHLPHAVHLGDYSPSTKSVNAAADISRLLDPSYLPSSTTPTTTAGNAIASSSSCSSFPKAYVDTHGELHDPDFKLFPVLSSSSGGVGGRKRRRASSSLSAPHGSLVFGLPHSAGVRDFENEEVEVEEDDEEEEEEEEEDLEGLSYPSPTHLRLGLGVRRQQQQQQRHTPHIRPRPSNQTLSSSPHFPVTSPFHDDDLNIGGGGASPGSSYDSAEDGWLSESHMGKKNDRFSVLFLSERELPSSINSKQHSQSQSQQQQQRLKKPKRLSFDSPYPYTYNPYPSEPPGFGTFPLFPSSTTTTTGTKEESKRCKTHKINNCLCQHHPSPLSLSLTTRSSRPLPIQVLGLDGGAGEDDEGEIDYEEGSHQHRLRLGRSRTLGGGESTSQSPSSASTSSCLDSIKKEWQSLLLTFGMGMVRWKRRGNSNNKRSLETLDSVGGGWGGVGKKRGRGISFSSVFSGNSMSAGTGVGTPTVKGSW